MTHNDDPCGYLELLDALLDVPNFQFFCTKAEAVEIKWKWLKVVQAVQEVGDEMVVVMEGLRLSVKLDYVLLKTDDLFRQRGRAYLPRCVGGDTKLTQPKLKRLNKIFFANRQPTQLKLQDCLCLASTLVLCLEFGTANAGCTNTWCLAGLLCSEV